jgi:hypothetical protein
VGLDFFQWLWVPSIGVTDETKRSVVGERMSETLRGLCGSVPANALVRATAHSGTARADSGSGRTRLIHAVFDSLLTLIWVSAVAVQARPSCSPGNGICGQRLAGDMAQTTGERPEFGSQTVLRLANIPESRGFLSPRKRGRFAGTGWWRTQSCKTSLRGPFPANREKNRDSCLKWASALDFVLDSVFRTMGCRKIP